MGCLSATGITGNSTSSRGRVFLAFGDDLKAFPVEVRDDGYLYVGLAKGEKEAAKRRVIERGKRALERGLKDRSTFFIAKSRYSTS